MLSDLQRSKLFKLSLLWRIIAQPVGPLHAWWDYIFDVECLLYGQKPMLDENADWYIQYGTDALINWKECDKFRLHSYLDQLGPLVTKKEEYAEAVKKERLAAQAIVLKT